VSFGCYIYCLLFIANYPETEQARQALTSEVQALKSEKTSLQSENETLRKRNDSLEESNRSALAIIDAKNTANAELYDELQKQQKKISELKQQISSLTVATQEAQNAASTADFRQKSVEQQLELAQKNNEWLENELKVKSAEALKTRKEKGARIAELQRLNEEANSRIDSLARTEQDLRRQLAESQRKLEEKINEVQQLEERAAQEEERFRQDQESLSRLLELQKEQANTHKKRLHDVEIRLEQVRDDAVEEVRKIQQALEKEREDHAQTTQRVEELQTEVDRYQAILATQGLNESSAPQTPRPNGSIYGRASSPFGTPGSLRGKASQRATDTVGELYQAKAQLAGERRRNKQLQEELDELAGLLEAKAPEIQEASEEVERLRLEAVQMSQIMERSYEERDIAVKASRKAEAAAASSQTELKILQSQIRDLSTQVHVLIFNIHAKEKGLAQLTEEEAAQFERIQRGEISQDALDDLSPTHRFISERFVVFKDVHELQAKNQELLRMTRELADRMENEEALAEKHQAAEDHEEVETLRGTVIALQDDVKSLTVRMKSYMAERDMFRRMLQQKATSGEINAALGSSVEGSQREVLASIENQSHADDADLASALRQLQAQFDSYRNDEATDRKTLREQIDTLSAENSSLKIANANIKSHLTVAEERLKILQSNFESLQHENGELQKRNQSLSETSAKQDIRTTQVAEELLEARGLVEGMRNENANLKAEKALWKGIQDRLEQDNKSLVSEKARLNTLLSDQQNSQNERDLAAAETKRRLESQVDALENELSATKRKLASEIDASRQAQLVKEHDTKEAQKRIDQLASTLNELKQENVALKTSRDHLQARVDELTVELRGAEERTQRLRPLPTPRSQPAAAAATHDMNDAEAEARIQELEYEVADLKNNLELAHTHLENTKAQMEEYKQLSTDVEDELSSATATLEQFREEMETALASKDSTVSELNQRIEVLTSELTNSTSELNRLRDSQAETARKAEEKERILNEEIARLKDEEDRYKEAARNHLQDLRDQAEIAAQAQQAHDEELVKHAKAAEALQALRAEYNTIKTQATTWRIDAESAKQALAQSERSWEERRQLLEQEISDIKTRWDDANAQNKLLHKQLETMGKQIHDIQQQRSSAADAADATSGSAAIADSATEGIRELNTYLRREKEILEVQYDMKTQEANSLRQKLEYAQSQLDDTRLKLEQERRAQADTGRAAMTHKELMDKLTELNLYKESNVTLRNQNLRTETQLAEKTAKVNELEARIAPLEARITELEDVQAFKEEEIKQLQEDRERWQKRTESILTKYGQADPAEVEKLKETVEALTAERDQLKESEQSLQAKVEEAAKTLEEEQAKWNASKQQQITQFKSQYSAVKVQRNEAQTAKNELQAELDSVKEQLANLEQELQAVREEKAALEERNKTLEQEVQSAAAAGTGTAPAQEPAPQAADSDSTQELETVKQELETVKQELENVKQELESLRQELEEVSGQKAAADAQVEDLQQRLAAAVSERNEAVAAQTAQAMQMAANGGDDNTQNGAQHFEPTVVNLSDEERQELQAQIVAAEAKVAEFEAKAQEIESKITTTIKERSDRMKDSLNKKLKESKEAIEKEKAQMQEDFKIKMEQERAIIIAELQAAPRQNGVPATPSKVDHNQPPQTPTVATPGGNNIDMGNLSDAQTRDLLSTNPTVKAIVANNIKKKVDQEAKKIREEAEAAVRVEYELKIVNAKEQATTLTEKKSSLKLNIQDRQLKTCQAKLSIVETAAKETPERPVGEVWEIAKDAKPVIQPPPAAAPTAAAQAPSSAPSKYHLRLMVGKIANIPSQAQLHQRSLHRQESHKHRNRRRRLHLRHHLLKPTRSAMVRPLNSSRHQAFQTPSPRHLNRLNKRRRPLTPLNSSSNNMLLLLLAPASRCHLGEGTMPGAADAEEPAASTSPRVLEAAMDREDEEGAEADSLVVATAAALTLVRASSTRATPEEPVTSGPAVMTRTAMAVVRAASRGSVEELVASRMVPRRAGQGVARVLWWKTRHLVRRKSGRQGNHYGARSAIQRLDIWKDERIFLCLF
jgi:nucleoprotein TPR